MRSKGGRDIGMRLWSRAVSSGRSVPMRRVGCSGGRARESKTGRRRDAVGGDKILLRVGTRRRGERGEGKRIISGEFLGGSPAVASLARRPGHRTRYDRVIFLQLKISVSHSGTRGADKMLLSRNGSVGSSRNRTRSREDREGMPRQDMVITALFGAPFQWYETRPKFLFFTPSREASVGIGSAKGGQWARRGGRCAEAQRGKMNDFRWTPPRSPSVAFLAMGGSERRWIRNGALPSPQNRLPPGCRWAGE